ncbi:thiamine phosphate synthase [Crocinitomicaceae bacterium]|nr:thiamine phosphate synthase [Crocinitomicaceae bacterium]
MTQSVLRDGLYAITDGSLIPAAELTARVAQAIAGGATVIQYREKQLATTERHRQAAELADLCRRHDVPLLINDDVELAAAVGAAGVHLGRDDTAIRAARSRLGSHAIIGMSCYNSLQRAKSAAAEGADYVAFGRFFPSHTKPDAVQAETTLLQRARRLLTLPLVAIGGITPENGATLLAAGANLLAVIHGIFGQPEVQAAAQRYTDIFEVKK